MNVPARMQRGFSLIEIVVGTALTGLVLASALALAQRSNDQTTGRSQADQLTSFQQLAGQYFIANRTAIEAAMGGDATKAAQYCQINVPLGSTTGTLATNSAKRTCAFDATLLNANGLWPVGMSVDAIPGQARYVAIVRQIMTTGGTPAPTGADEMLIVLAPESGGNVQTTGTVAFSGDVKRAADQIEASMAAMGGTGGFIPPGTDYGNCQYNATTEQVCGAGWAVVLSDFIN